MPIERKPYSIADQFVGDFDLFGEVVNSQKVSYMLDLDQIIAASADSVFEDFYSKTGIRTTARDITCWDHLTNLSVQNGLSEEQIKNAENGWFDPEILKEASRILWIRPLIIKILNRENTKSVKILTARSYKLIDSTRELVKRILPEFRGKEDNILIRNTDYPDAKTFKANMICEASKESDWVILIDDHVVNVKTALDDARYSNLYAINVPEGHVWPDFIHPRLMVVRRFPKEVSGVYPLYDLFVRAWDKQKIDRVAQC